MHLVILKFPPGTRPTNPEGISPAGSTVHPSSSGQRPPSCLGPWACARFAQEFKNEFMKLMKKAILLCLLCFFKARRVLPEVNPFEDCDLVEHEREVYIWVCPQVPLRCGHLTLQSGPQSRESVVPLSHSSQG